MRCREAPGNTEMAIQAFPEFGLLLDVVIRPVDLPLTVAEIHVGGDEDAVRFENMPYLGELSFLHLAGILEDPWAVMESNRTPRNSMGFSMRSSSIRFGAGSWTAISSP